MVIVGSLKSGRVAIFVEERVIYKKIKNLINKINPSDMVFELASSEISVGERTLVVLAVYHSPNGDIDAFFDKLSEILDIATNGSNHVILMEDLNIDPAQDTYNANRHNDIILSFNSELKVNQPTRVTEYSATIIDHVATDFVTETFQVEVVNSLISHNYALRVDTGIDGVEKQSGDAYFKTIIDVSDENIQRISNALSIETCTDVFAEDSINDK